MYLTIADQTWTGIDDILLRETDCIIPGQIVRIHDAGGNAGSWRVKGRDDLQRVRREIRDFTFGLGRWTLAVFIPSDAWENWHRGEVEATREAVRLARGRAAS